jgi:hypothetical protein
VTDKFTDWAAMGIFSRVREMFLGRFAMAVGNHGPKPWFEAAAANDSGRTSVVMVLLWFATVTAKVSQQ